MLSLSGLKARLLLQQLVPLITWSVGNVTAEIRDCRLISLDTNRVSPEEDLLWGRYLKAIKCDCLVLSLGRRFTI